MMLTENHADDGLNFRLEWKWMLSAASILQPRVKIFPSPLRFIIAYLEWFLGPASTTFMLTSPSTTLQGALVIAFCNHLPVSTFSYCSNIIYNHAKILKHSVEGCRKGCKTNVLLQIKCVILVVRDKAPEQLCADYYKNTVKV